MADHEQASPWLATARDLTERLVAVRSVSPGAGEVVAAAAVRDLLREDGLEGVYQFCDLANITGDPFGRANAIAVLPGASDRAVVLLGHIDTVGIDDYGSLAPIATSSADLAAHQTELLDGATLDRPDEWLFGRGALDMKSGVAAHIAIMRHYAARLRDTGTPPPLTLVLVATPDEETQSAGALAASGWLAAWRAGHGLRYAGLINTDYVSPRYAGDTERPIYTGTVGKLLPLFYVVGKATHVGDAYDGIDANLLAAELIRDLSMNPALADRHLGAVTPPPVTLHAADLKTTYNVQTPYAAWFYLNVLTLATTPASLMTTLTGHARHVLDGLLARLARDYVAWRDEEGVAVPAHLTGGRVLTYAELRDAAIAARGTPVVESLIVAVRAGLPADLDSRVATLHVIEALWRATGLSGPAVVIAYAPPYYPHIADDQTPLADAARVVAARHTAEGIVTRPFYPFLSDLSYMRSVAGGAPDDLTRNLPLWSERAVTPGGGGYGLPFGDIAAAGIEGVINVGPFGAGAHQRGERVWLPYSCGVVPQLILEIIEELAARG